MNKTLKTILIALLVLVLLIATGIGVNSWKEYKLVKENTLRVESEMRFKQQVIEGKKLEKQLDTLNITIGQKQAVIDNLENNPTIIIKNNERSHIDIDRLNAYNSIVRFTDNAIKYQGYRAGRYNLHRFDKHN